MPLTYCYGAFPHLQGIFAKIKATAAASFFRKCGTVTLWFAQKLDTLYREKGKKKVCSYSNTIKVKDRGKIIGLPTLRTLSKYKTSAWIVGGPVLFCMVWEWGQEEGKTDPADILQSVCKQHKFKAINI